RAPPGPRGPAPPAWRRGLGALTGLLGALALAAALLRMARPRPLWPVLVCVGAGAALLAAGAALRRGPVCGPETPGMAPYHGGPARVVLRNLSPPGPEMRLDVLVAPAQDAG